MPSMPDHCNWGSIFTHAALGLFALSSGAISVEAADPQAMLREAFQLTMSRPLRFEGSLTRFDPNGRVGQRSRWRFERSGRLGEGRLKVTFMEPQDLMGVQLLTRTGPDQSVEQWLYTPATDRARPVRPDARGRRFYSTDFSFDDLQEGDVGLESYRLLAKREAVGESCWRIEAETSAGSPYDHKVFFISEVSGLIIQTDHFLDSSRVKRILYRGYRNLDGVWLPRQIEAFDIETGWRTVVVVEDSQVGVNFSDTAFAPESLGSP